VSGQLHAPAALPPGKSPRYPLYIWFSNKRSLPKIAKNAFQFLPHSVRVIRHKGGH
jgi:hypothetical protein